jgi:hypothetical protein
MTMGVRVSSVPGQLTDALGSAQMQCPRECKALLLTMHDAQSQTCPEAILKPTSMSDCSFWTSQSLPRVEADAATGSKCLGSVPTTSGMSNMHLQQASKSRSADVPAQLPGPLFQHAPTVRWWSHENPHTTT